MCSHQKLTVNPRQVAVFYGLGLQTHPRDSSLVKVSLTFIHYHYPLDSHDIREGKKPKVTKPKRTKQLPPAPLSFVILAALAGLFNAKTQMHLWQTEKQHERHVECLERSVKNVKSKPIG